MGKVKYLAAPGAAGEQEARQINAHALGVSLTATPEADMKRFENIEKERLVQQHTETVATLHATIEESRAHAAGLEAQIRRLGKRENKLMLGMGALAMVVAYFYVRDFGCSLPLWTRIWGS